MKSRKKIKLTVSHGLVAQRCTLGLCSMDKYMLSLGMSFLYSILLISSITRSVSPTVTYSPKAGWQVQSVV